MLLIQGRDIIKEFGDRKIFHIEDIKIYSTDRIGIVGRNGQGKTTLLNILAGIDNDFKGNIERYGNIGYIEQFGELDKPDELILKQIGLKGIPQATMSGGEATKLKNATALSSKNHLILADEPTSNLDLAGIHKLREALLSFKGGVVLITHEKNLLNDICNKIIEIEDGKIQVFTGNYDDYALFKQQMMEANERAYENYIDKRNQLVEASQLARGRARKAGRAPSRMGNSEARIQKGALSESTKHMEKQAKVLENRIERLEKVDKPYQRKVVKVPVPSELELSTPYPIKILSGKKMIQNRFLFETTSISIPKGKKIAILGNNGTGKTTLINMIRSNELVNTSQNLQIGYFYQDLKNLDPHKSILENVLADSPHSETLVRTVLGSLLFRGDDVLKKVAILSGGERMKVSFAKVFLGRMNLLILDEPTNYLDIESKEAFIEVITGYNGTVLFVSHDVEFINGLADGIMMIQDQKLTYYAGNYNSYLDAKNSRGHEDKGKKEKRMMLELKMSQLVGELSLPKKQKDIEALEEQYQQVLRELNVLNN